jgi:hypothetical protein
VLVNFTVPDKVMHFNSCLPYQQSSFFVELAGMRGADFAKTGKISFKKWYMLPGFFASLHLLGQLKALG